MRSLRGDDTSTAQLLDTAGIPLEEEQPTNSTNLVNPRRMCGKGATHSIRTNRIQTCKCCFKLQCGRNLGRTYCSMLGIVSVRGTLRLTLLIDLYVTATQVVMETCAADLHDAAALLHVHRSATWEEK